LTAENRLEYDNDYLNEMIRQGNIKAITITLQ